MTHRTPRALKHLAASGTACLLMACSGGGDSPEPAAPPASSPAPGNLTVSTSVSGSGSVSPSTGSVASGGTATFTVSAASGYQLVGVSGCGGSLSGNTYTTAAITAACTVTAVFNSTSTSTSAGFGPQSSTFAADHDFDFAERFDGLRDWAAVPGSPGNVSDPALLPRLEGGGASAWTFFSKWGSTTDPEPWIAAHGGNRVWRGTKSAAIDLNNRKGPSRLGLFTGKPYKENVYYFYMVNIPKNEWPTFKPEPATLPASYVEGDPYTYYGSWKFMTFNYGCGNVNCWDHPPPHSGYSPIAHMINHIKTFGYSTYSTYGLTGIEPGLYLNQETPDHERDMYAITEQGKSPLNSKVGDWFGVEFQLTQNTDGTVTRNLWVYDKNGNATQQMMNQSWNVPGYNANLGWDFFFHGGNNSGTYTWGPSMESVYYIDDVIIDDKRIGPKYFRAIGVTQ